MTTPTQFTDYRVQRDGASIIRTITGGQVDNSLNEIVEAVSARHRSIAALKSLDITVSNRVRVNNKSRKYDGMVGHVTNKHGKWITVVEDGGLHRTVDFSPVLLEVLH